MSGHPVDENTFQSSVSLTQCALVGQSRGRAYIRHSRARWGELERRLIFSPHPWL